MNKIVTFLSLTIALTSSSQLLKAQYVIKEADAQYELLNYSKAINLYEEAYKKKATLHTAERLAESYQLLSNYVQAESWYATAVSMPDSKAENTLNYAKMLQQNSKYTEAKAQYISYFQKAGNVSESLRRSWLASCDSAINWMKNPRAVLIANQKDLNSAQSDFGSFPYQNGLIFISDRTSKQADIKTKKPFLKFDGARLPNEKVYGWTGNGYLKLYIKQGTDSVAPFPLNANTNYHVGAATFTADGNTVYFTSTRLPERIDKATDTIKLGIYSSTKGNGGDWTAPVAFAYNNVNKYSTGDPFITSQGNRLYFVSDMAGGLGGTDIYYVEKTSEGEWGKPVNMQSVNTPGNERTPFVDGENRFYFASDGGVGMGGLDIFELAKNGSGAEQVKNMGYPINSPQDDFAFNINSANGAVYLSSNRTGGLGSDDIYSFDNKTIFAFKLNGRVYDKATNQPVANANVTLQREDGSALKVETDASGIFNFKLNDGADFTLSGEKRNYRSDVAQLNTKGLSSLTTIEKDLFLEPIDFSKEIVLRDIYYDFDKWEIRPDAALALDKLVATLNDNPTIWIELASHTDSRGNAVYNQVLSEKRAKAAVQYIVSKGINKNRIEAKGLGENELLNRCSDGVKCTAAEHQLNRRTTFKIVRQ
ncbi:OmpA family protein [Pedobacter endophyticus]|uniref:OmpA family protein n=1 Tax=Pedobacter endophyticus TaxID=2789740 RepID=A0A7S9L1I7_9SPHI|nr:OmpA family protein [Pedobacter endophyticus]QPH40489.1 OmpA family protein [Pedobacter endophyticus]